MNPATSPKFLFPWNPGEYTQLRFLYAMDEPRVIRNLEQDLRNTRTNLLISKDNTARLERLLRDSQIEGEITRDTLQGRLTEALDELQSCRAAALVNSNEQ